MMTMQAGELRLGKTIIGGGPTISLTETGATICIEIAETITQAEVDLVKQKCYMAVPSGYTVVDREGGGSLVTFEYAQYKRVNDAASNHSLDDDAYGRLQLAAKALIERLGC